MGRENPLQRSIIAMLRGEGAHVVTLNPTNGTGEPDLCGVLVGVAFAVEVKQPGEDPSPIQVATLRQWSNAGAVTAVARSVADARWVVGECLRRDRDASLGSPRRVLPSNDPDQETL